MATYREYYFKLKNHGDKKLFTETVIFSLLMDVSSLDKVGLTLTFDTEVKNEEKLKEYISQIENGIPYQYVLGYCEFLGKKFYVDNNVLIPRLETEELVLNCGDLIEKHFKNIDISVLDMCSGSGIIGISLASRFNVSVDMVDISNSANNVASKNNILHKTNCNIIKSDLFNDLSIKKYDVIISNPPYIKDESTVDKATLEHEPHLALFATPQTYFYEEIFKQKDIYYKDKYLLAFEIEEDMEEVLSSLIQKYFKDGATYLFKKDLYDKTRYLFIIKE